jgi:hypothetical protein
MGTGRARTGDGTLWVHLPPRRRSRHDRRVAHTTIEQARLSVASYLRRNKDRIDETFNGISDEYLDAAVEWDRLKADLPDGASPFDGRDMVKEPYRAAWERLVDAHSAWAAYSHVGV